MTELCQVLRVEHLELRWKVNTRALDGNTKFDQDPKPLHFFRLEKDFSKVSAVTSGFLGGRRNRTLGPESLT